MEQLIETLEQTGGVLRTPAMEKDTQVDWADWRDRFNSWQVALHELCTVVKPYVDVEEKLLSTPADMYKSQHWSWVGRRVFPDDDTLHDYKTFGILFQNFQSLKQQMVVAVRHKAHV
jgi:hypothetical protein